MRPQIRLYEHPDFKPDERDVTLLSTVCLVLGLAITGALFILTMSCLLFWDDCRSCESYHPSLIVARRLTRTKHILSSATGQHISQYDSYCPSRRLLIPRYAVPCWYFVATLIFAQAR